MGAENNQPEASHEKHSSTGVMRVLQSKDEIRSYYNKIARVYDLLAERTEDPMRWAGFEMLAPQPGETVLEIGFGTGHCLVEFARRVSPGGKVHGVDLSDEMVRIAGELVKKEGFASIVQLSNQDAASLPFEDGSVDAVFMSFALELFDTPEIPRVLAECKRILKTGGRIAVVSISKVQPTDPMVKVFEWTHRHFPNLLDCRPIYARQELEAAGFEIQKYEIRHMWLPVEIVLGRKG